MPNLNLDIAVVGTTYQIASAEDALVFGQALSRCMQPGFTASVVLVLMSENNKLPGDKIGEIH